LLLCRATPEDVQYNQEMTAPIIVAKAIELGQTLDEVVNDESNEGAIFAASSDMFNRQKRIKSLLEDKRNDFITRSNSIIRNWILRDHFCFRSRLLEPRNAFLTTCRFAWLDYYLILFKINQFLTKYIFIDLGKLSYQLAPQVVKKKVPVVKSPNSSPKSERLKQKRKMEKATLSEDERDERQKQMRGEFWRDYFINVKQFEMLSSIFFFNPVNDFHVWICILRLKNEIVFTVSFRTNLSGRTSRAEEKSQGAPCDETALQ